MPRKSPPLSDTFPSDVRRYFGLQQEELAQYLDISRGLISNVEAGRRNLPFEALVRLEPLLEQLPREQAARSAMYLTNVDDEPPPTAIPTAEPIEDRLYECLYQARQLRNKRRELLVTFRKARRWQQALPTLQAAPPTRATSAELHALNQQWLRIRANDAAQALDGDAAAQYHLLTLRAEALEAEATALFRLLSAPPAWLPSALLGLPIVLP